jgi:hypothetical protein
MRHLQEKQVGELFQVVAVGEFGIAQDIAVIPKLLDN